MKYNIMRIEKATNLTFTQIRQIYDTKASIKNALLILGIFSLELLS